MLCQVPGFSNWRDLWAYQISYKTCFTYIQAVFSKKKNYFLANMHYIIKIKQTKRRNSAPERCEIAEIPSGLETAASVSHWQIHPPLHVCSSRPLRDWTYTHPVLQITSAPCPPSFLDFSSWDTVCFQTSKM